MSDTIGRITVPALVDSGQTWTLKPDMGYGYSQDWPVVIHRFGELDSKAEQRFKVGIGPRKYAFRRQRLSKVDRASLAQFWENCQGPLKSFTYPAPDAAQAFTNKKVTFEATPISFNYLVNAVQTGMYFCEVPDPTAAPTYAISSTVLPSGIAGSLQTALQSQVQEMIPLVHIRVREGAVGDIYLSDRRCTVGGQLYLPRLLGIGDPSSDALIVQDINGAADNVQFTFGNADRVMTALANDTDLKYAEIDLCLYHVNSSTLIQLWMGEIIKYACDGSAQFTIQCSDPLFHLTQSYPKRVVSRTCWKTFNDGVNCPYSAHGSGGDPTKCDYYFDSSNGCRAHGMQQYFGGHPAAPQGVQIKDNSTGTWGFGRSTVTATSIISDSIWGKALQEIWCNDHGDPRNAFWAMAMIVAGRDESDFYDALGIVGAGPLGQYTGMSVQQNSDGFRYIVAPLLDGFTAHGFKVDGGLNVVTNNPALGLREVIGTDPTDQSVVDDRFVLTNVSPSADNRAAGTALCEIRRVKDSAIKPTLTDEHEMRVPVSQGLAGWTWDAGGTRTLTPGLTNPFWIALNCYLRSIGLFNADSATQLEQFVLSSFIDGAGNGAAEIADNLAAKLVGGAGTETQFQFQGVLAQQKPLRDWLTEILSCALGYYTWEFGKLKVGIRINASAVNAFTTGNTIFQSLRLEPVEAQFERLIVEYADQAAQYQANTAEYQDKDHAAYYGRQDSPLTARMHSVGSPTLSQSLRLAAVRTREEIGGVVESEWKKARNAYWKTTVLALNTTVGQVVSQTHADIPAGSGKFRIQSWKLNRDWSIDIAAKSVQDSMYDLTVGPKPQDVTPAPLPGMHYPVPRNAAWAPYHVQAAANDALFPGEWNFEADQLYRIQAGGEASAALVVIGKLPVTEFIADCPVPVIGTITQSTTGGSIPGGSSLRVTIVAFDVNGKPSPSARIAIVLIPTGTNTNKVTLSDITWPEVTGLATYQVFASTSDELICAQQGGSLTAGGGGTTYTPTSIVITGPLARSTWALPSPYISKIRIKAKKQRHGGVAGAGVSSVADYQIVSSDMVDTSGTPFNATGRIISVIGRPVGATPFASFLVSAHDPATGTFTIDPSSPNPNGIVQPFDAIVIRNKADAGNAGIPTRITDSGYRNSLNGYSGLELDAEVGMVLRVIQGTGRGQLRKITGNTDVMLIWDDPLVLDTTSIWIVEEASWIWFGDSTAMGIVDHSQPTTMIVPAQNLLEQPVVISGFTVDVDGPESPDGNAPIREDWIFGSQGTREVTADDTQRITDGTLLFDTTAGNITYQCLSASQVPNVYLVLQKITVGDGNTVTINAASGEAFEDGSTSIALTDTDAVAEIRFHG